MIKRVVFYSLFVFIIAFSAGRAEARRAIITNASAQVTKQQIILFFQVDGVFTSKLDEAVRSGIPIGITYTIELFRDMKGWFDEKIAVWAINRTLQYDAVRSDYELNLGIEKTPIYVKDYEKAKALLVSFDHIPILSTSALKPGMQYFFKVRAQLSPINLPHFVDSLLLSRAPWDFDTAPMRVDIKLEQSSGGEQ